jgi:hypothetical protein
MGEVHMARLKALGAAKGQELLSVVYVDECIEYVIRIAPPPVFFHQFNPDQKKPRDIRFSVEKARLKS